MFYICVRMYIICAISIYLSSYSIYVCTSIYLYMYILGRNPPVFRHGTVRKGAFSAPSRTRHLCDTVCEIFCG